MKHTPIPWKLETHSDLGKNLIIGRDNILVGNIVEIKNAERILACVNACEGLSNEALESGIIKKLLKACKIVSRFDRPYFKDLPGWGGEDTKAITWYAKP